MRELNTRGEMGNQRMRQAREEGRCCRAWEPAGGASWPSSCQVGTAEHRQQKTHPPNSSTAMLAFLFSSVRPGKRIVAAPVLPCLTLCPQGSRTTRAPHVAWSRCTVHRRLPPGATQALSNIPTRPPAPPRHSGLS